jgi:hypothetical protein
MGAFDDLTPLASAFSDLVPSKTPKATLGDYGRGVLTGLVGDTAKGAGYLMELAGLDNAGRGVREFGQRFEQGQLERMTPAGQAAAQSSVFTGEGLSDLGVSDNWAQALGMGAARSLPSMAVMAIPGAAATGVLSRIPAFANAATAAGTAAKAGVAAPLATRVMAAAPAALGYGASEGIHAGAVNAADILGELEAAGNPNAAEAARQTFLRTAPLTAAFGMATGGGALGLADRLARGTARQGLGRAILSGAGQEALQETLQSGGEQYVQQGVRQEFVDPSISPWLGVPAAALSGGAVGGLTGGVFGGAGRVAAPRDPREVLLSQAADVARKHQEMKALPKPTVDASSGPSIEAQIASQRGMDEATQHADQVYAERAAEEKRRADAFAAIDRPEEPKPTKPEGLDLADPKTIFDAVTARPAIFDTIRKAAEALPEPKAEEVDTRPDVAKAIQELQADPKSIFDLAQTKPEIFQTIARMSGELEDVSAKRGTYGREREALTAVVNRQPLTAEDAGYLVKSGFAKQEGERVRVLPPGRRRLKEIEAQSAEFAAKTDLELDQAAKLTRSPEKREAITAEIDRRQTEIPTDGNVEIQLQEPNDEGRQQAGQQVEADATGAADAGTENADDAQGQEGVLKPVKTREERARERSNRFLKMVAEMGGVNTQHALDITGEKNLVRFGGMASRVFRKNGLGIDDVALYLNERGYISSEEYSDVDGGVQRARDIIRAAVEGNLEPLTDAEAEAEYAAMQRDAEELADREEANIDPDEWDKLDAAAQEQKLDELFGADTRPSDQGVPTSDAEARAQDPETAAREEAQVDGLGQGRADASAVSGAAASQESADARAAGFDLAAEQPSDLTSRAQERKREDAEQAETKALADREAELGLTLQPPAGSISAGADPLASPKNQTGLFSPNEGGGSVRDMSRFMAPAEVAEMTRAVQMTREQYAQSIADRFQTGPTGGLTREQHVRMMVGAAKTNHGFYVKQALAQGQPVPEEVLADYPDLQPTPAPPTQEDGAGRGERTFADVTHFSPDPDRKLERHAYFHPIEHFDPSNLGDASGALIRGSVTLKNPITLPLDESIDITAARVNELRGQGYDGVISDDGSEVIAFDPQTQFTERGRKLLQPTTSPSEAPRGTSERPMFARKSDLRDTLVREEGERKFFDSLVRAGDYREGSYPFFAQDIMGVHMHGYEGAEKVALGVRFKNPLIAKSKIEASQQLLGKDVYGKAIPQPGRKGAVEARHLAADKKLGDAAKAAGYDVIVYPDEVQVIDTSALPDLRNLTFNEDEGAYFVEGAEQWYVGQGHDEYIARTKKPDTSNFRRSTPAAQSDPAQVREWSAEVSARLGVPIVVHDDPQSATEATGTFVYDDATGFFYKGRINIVSSNIQSRLGLEITTWHEAFHAGLRAKHGRDFLAYAKALQAVARANPEVARRASQWRMQFGKDFREALTAEGTKNIELHTRLQSIEEALADMSGARRGNISLLHELISAAQKLMRAMGLDTLADWIESHTDAEALAFISDALQTVMRPGKAPQYGRAMRGAPAMSRSQTKSEAFRKWFGKSAVVDANGEPMVVYHGTTADITTFQPSPKNQLFGPGFYFTANPQYASAYASNVNTIPSSIAEGGNVMPVYVRLENPYLYDAMARGKHPSGLEIAARARKGGHDGIIVKGSLGEMQEVVAFEATQIKSAIGNRGTFDPNDSRIAFSRGNRASWDSPEPSKLDDFIYTLQDKHIDTRRVIQRLREKSRVISDARNVYLQEELYHGRTAKRTQDFINEELKPLLQDMVGRGVTTVELEEYLHARHAPERNAQIAKVNPSMPDGGSGMTNKEASDYFAKLDARKKQQLDALAQKLDAITAGTRQLIVSYGLEDQSAVKAWEQAYKHYVPLMRDESAPGVGQGFSVRGPASKRATGSKRAVVDILANVAMQREKAIVRGEKNRVANALVGLATTNPNPDFWTVDKPPKIRYVDERSGLVTESVDPLYKSRDNVVMARTPDANGKVVEHAVIFNEDDERAVRMAQALKNLDMDDLGTVLGASAKITRYFASINTQYNPIFGVVNLVRDTQGALFNLTSTPLRGKQTEVLQHTLSALRGIYIDVRDSRSGKPTSSSWAQLFEEFQNEGGQTGFRDMFRTSKDRAEAIERELKRITEGKAQQVGRAVFDWLSDYNTAMENAVRLAAYKVAKDGGMSNQQAASVAKNLTVNFNRKGQITTQAGALYAFFNASVQGTARLAETLTGPAGKKIIAGGLTLGVIQALALAAAGFDDDEPPDFVRERNIIIPIGDSKYITIPMPLGLHFLPNLGRIPTEYVLSGFRDPGKRISQLVGMFAEAFNPVGNAGLSLQTIAPTIVDPLAAIAENRDWTGKPIARPNFGLNVTPGHMRAKDTASAFSKTVSRALNWMSGGTEYKPGAFSPTPDQIDYLIGQVTGGVGREVMKVEQTAASAFTGEDLPTYKIPLLGRFYGNSDDSSAQANKFYANLKLMNEHEAEIRGRRKAGEPIRDYLEANPEARLFDAANKIEREVSKLRKVKRELVERDADRDQVKRIEEQINVRMKRFNDTVNRLREKEPA